MVPAGAKMLKKITFLRFRVSLRLRSSCPLQIIKADEGTLLLGMNSKLWHLAGVLGFRSTHRSVCTIVV